MEVTVVLYIGTINELDRMEKVASSQICLLVVNYCREEKKIWQ
jgi:hypothetical protein